MYLPEVIDQLARDSRKKFINKKTGLVIQVNPATGILEYKTGGKFYVVFTGDSMKDEWEEVKTPVPFIEAIKAFHEGKTIICSLGTPYVTDDNCVSVFRPGESYGFLGRIIERETAPITTTMILEGEWYIED